MKKNNIIFWVLIILLSATLTAAVTVFLEFRKMKSEIVFYDDAPNERMHFRMMQGLNFSEEQESIFCNCKQRHIQRVHEVMPTLFQKKKQIVDEFSKEEYNDSLLNVYAQELGMIYYQMQLLDIEHIKELLDICDKEQQFKVRQQMLPAFFMRDMPKRRGQHQNGRHRMQNGQCNNFK